MATTVHPRLFQAQYNRIQTPGREPLQCVRVVKNTVLDPYKPVKNATHTFLQVQKAILPYPKISVSIIKGPKEKKIVDIETAKVVRQMLQIFPELKPIDEEDQYVVHNGKIVSLEQKLCDLQVKEGDTFIICRKCHGG